ncbi:formimidoylglutamase [uncultured Corynebacterium sp.]|uniref:formimidoylglutamase n=1 Tax=uncultured Corynebacterium sp. TaxID=159447 RepID=UPI0025D373B2|nr:formimidoylglutamase [uncultured Corynebacterium sp.]
MNTVDAPLYSPAPAWSGRDDGPGAEHARWHTVIRGLSLADAAGSISTTTSPSDAPGAALLGFASDEGVARNGGRQGAAAGPDAIRAALGSLAVHHAHPLYDAGTITTQGTDLEGAHAALADAVASLTAAGHLPIVLGGGHETAFGSHSGAYRALNLADGPQRGPLQVVNLDAHFDLRTADAPTSGTPFKQISQLVGPESFHYAVLGISRPNNTKVLFDEAATLGVRVVEDVELLDLTPSAAGRLAVDAAGGADADSPIHLSIDLDVLTAAQAPGVSAPAALGVPLAHIRAMAVALAATGRLALVDVVELNPTFDIDGRTAKVAARLIDDIVTAHGGE